MQWILEQFAYLLWAAAAAGPYPWLALLLLGFVRAARPWRMGQSARPVLEESFEFVGGGGEILGEADSGEAESTSADS